MANEDKMELAREIDDDIILGNIATKTNIRTESGSGVNIRPNNQKEIKVHQTPSLRKILNNWYSMMVNLIITLLGQQGDSLHPSDQVPPKLHQYTA